MAYTRVWVNNAPAGGNNSNTADDEIRNLRGDVEERMATLVTGWTTGGATDPVVVKPEILGNVLGKKLFLHHSLFACHSNANESRINEYTAPSVNGNNDFWAPLVLPVGVTLQIVTGLFDRQSQTITLELGYTDASTGVFTSISSVTDAATAAIFQKSLSALAHVIVTNRFYVIRARLPGTGGVLFSRLYGAFVSYDTPDCRNTA